MPTTPEIINSFSSSVSFMNHTIPRVRRLPNGRLRACDPCRRQKLSCNHALPCQRCSRKKDPTQCTYQGEPHTPSPIPTRHTVQSRYLSHPGSGPGPSSSSERSSKSRQNGRVQKPPTSAVAVGYLGSTSFEAVLEETQASLNHLGAPVSSMCDGGGDDHAHDLLSDCPAIIKEICLSVLRAVPQPADGFKAFQDWVSPEVTWQHRVAKLFLQDLYDAWGSYLTSPRTDAKLEEMARILCDNTHREVSDDVAQFDEWLQQFSGPNMRWEALGLIFYYLKPAGSAVAPKAREPMGQCIRICRELITRPTIWLLYLYDRRASLESMYTGDASKMLLEPSEVISSDSVDSTCTRSLGLEISFRADINGDIPRISCGNSQCWRKAHGAARAQETSILGAFHHRQNHGFVHGSPATSRTTLCFHPSSARSQGRRSFRGRRHFSKCSGYEGGCRRLE